IITIITIIINKKAERRMKNVEWKFLNEGKSSSQHVIESLLKRFVNNFELTVTHVHIRYQDFTTVPFHPFAVGVTVEKLSVVNVDAIDNNAKNKSNDKNENDNNEDGDNDDDDDDDDDDDKERQTSEKENESKREENPPTIGKQINIHNVSVPSHNNPNMQRRKSISEMLKEDRKVYWSDETLSEEQMAKLLETLPSHDHSNPDYDLVLSPMSLEFMVHLNGSIIEPEDVHSNSPSKANDNTAPREKDSVVPSPQKPRTESMLSINSLNLVLTKEQLNTIQTWSEALKFVLARTQA
ncbi:phosphopantothenoylcysteine decarboxylase, partial [Reticulomyxa filosa]